ncbi:hypothetical protein [Aestuariivirga sp.]|uniref:hypothetical protein n=1 Tax=Aestuariivirga sp. TaxID=2650926 RepID=UPI0025C3AAC5|nr:hypothetical protein [Aestuariivirga sp.]
MKDLPAVSDPGSNATDDHMVSVLEARGNDPAALEICSSVNAMDEDRQIDLVAAAHDARTAEYLHGLPLLSEFFEDALSDCGRSCEDEEMGSGVSPVYDPSGSRVSAA